MGYFHQPIKKKSWRQLHDKKKSQIVHAKKRAKQRYNLDLKTKDINIIIRGIRDNKSIPIEKQTNRVSTHFIKFRGKICVVVYDKIRKSIASFLPEEYKNEYIDKLFKIEKEDENG